MTNNAEALRARMSEIEDAIARGKMGAHGVFTQMRQVVNAALASQPPAVSVGEAEYGPRVIVRRRCGECKACSSASYRCQSDSGSSVYCEHPSLPKRKYIGDTTWETPGWCPALTAALNPTQDAAHGGRDDG